jgi:hypothetical protein
MNKKHPNLMPISDVPDGGCSWAVALCDNGSTAYRRDALVKASVLVFSDVFQNLNTTVAAIAAVDVK